MVNEDISKELSEKGVRIAIRVSKPVVRKVIKALEIIAGAAGNAVKEKVHPTKGKQSVKTLIRQGQGVTSIPLADEGLKDFEKIARKYGVDFSVVKDKNVSPPAYTIFFKAKDMDAVTRILQDYSTKQVKKDISRESVLSRLEKFKQKVAEMPKKVLEKAKVMER